MTRAVFERRRAAASAPRFVAGRAARRHAAASAPRFVAGRAARRRGSPAGTRPAAILTATLLLAAACAAPPSAMGGSVRVSQCRAADGGGWTPAAFQANAWWVSGGWSEVACGEHGGGVRLGAPNWRLGHDAAATLHFAVPGSMPRTTARTAWLDWRFHPQSPSINPAFLTMVASGARLFTAVPGEGAVTRRELPTGTRRLDLNVWCSPVNGPGWCNWPGSLLALHGFTVELEESEPPSASGSGPLLEPRPQSGVEPVAIAAVDGDTGVRSVGVTLGGVAIASLEPADGCRADRLPPCPRELRGTVDVDTRSVVDGARRLRLVATDGAGNARTIDVAAIHVANQARVDTPPGPGGSTGGGNGGGTGGGTGGGDAGGERGGAPPASGLPSDARPAFPPNPLTGRGHVPNGRGATEGARLSAWLEPGRRPSGAPLRHRSATAPYGVRVRIRGRLTDPRSRGIGRAALAAARRERGGRWRAVTGVRTRADGRFTAFTRIGPSQQVRFVYYAYGDSRRGRSSPTLRVRVLR